MYSSKHIEQLSFSLPQIEEEDDDDAKPKTVIGINCSWAIGLISYDIDTYIVIGGNDTVVA